LKGVAERGGGPTRTTAPHSCAATLEPWYAPRSAALATAEGEAAWPASRAAERLGGRLGATALRRDGAVAAEIVQAAREFGVTQVVLGESHRPRWKQLVGPSIIARVLRETDGVDVHVIAGERPAPSASPLARPNDQGRLPWVLRLRSVFRSARHGGGACEPGNGL
jgi:K+-sensing histidine kinase KdpD